MINIAIGSAHCDNKRNACKDLDQIDDVLKENLNLVKWVSMTYVGKMSHFLFLMTLNIQEILYSTGYIDSNRNVCKEWIGLTMCVKQTQTCESKLDFL